MKRALVLLCPLALLVAGTGCEESLLGVLPANVQAIVSSVDGAKLDIVSKYAGFGAGDQDQVRQRLMDGSCDGDGNQYQHGGSNGGANGNGNAGSNGGGNGNGGSGGGNGDQLRLRDGSCGDGG